MRQQALPIGVFAVAAVALLASGPSRSVGVYRYLFGFHTGPLAVIHWAALDAMTLAYAAGWIIVPGALLGLWLALSRPRSTEELAFGVIALLVTVALFLEAGFLQASLTSVHEIQERYVFYAAPLLGLSFALYASRGWPLRLQHLALAGGLVLVSVRAASGRLCGRIDPERFAHPVRRLLAGRQAGQAGRRVRGRGGRRRADDGRRSARIETSAIRNAGGARRRLACDRCRVGRRGDLRRSEHRRREKGLPAERSLVGRPGPPRQRDAAAVVQRGTGQLAPGALLEPLDHPRRPPSRRRPVRQFPHRACAASPPTAHSQ